MRVCQSMNLNDTQRSQVARWVADGMKLSEIQNRLASELEVRLTYMEVRLLVDDLELTLKDPEQPKPAQPVASLVPNPPKPDVSAPVGNPGGSISLSVDQVARPGALVSGKVTFSDGMNADWYLDQTGRLGVVPQQQGYKPTASDVEQFQMALEREMAKLGF